MPEPASGHDIFISYASEDRDKAQQLATALESQGWTVWWDRTIPAGKTFADVIDEALAASRCVVAMWSGVSVGKNWVLEEAQDGLDRAILVPVLIESIDPPRGFRRIQAASLNDWDGSNAAAEFQQLVGDISHILGPPPTAEDAAASAPEAKEVPEAADGKAQVDGEQGTAEADGAGDKARPAGRTEETSQHQSIRGWLTGERLTGTLSVIVVIAMLAGFWIKDRYFDRATVPTVVDRTISEAERLLEEADIRYRKETKFDPNAESGTVLFQIPKGETRIQRDEVTVELIVALSVTVPDLIGARFDRAEIIAKAAQLALDQVRTDHDGAFADGAVLEQSPEAGTRVEPGTTLEVVINEYVPVQQPRTDPAVVAPIRVGKAQVTSASEIESSTSKVENLPIPEMVVIPAGSVQSDGAPVNVVRFAMSRFEITFDEFDAFARATGRKLPDDEGWGRGNRPVINVSWEDATAYAEWLSLQTDKRYRLPSEAEWEYAARAGTDTEYWWGNDIQEGGKVWANCDGCGSQWDNKQTAPVGSFPANGFGLHDTAGNVWEWVQDCWESDCVQRVIRGGSWDYEPQDVRSALRNGDGPGNRGNDLGFRLAQDL